ncbi:hypothetical protein MPTK1_5g20450 [Marchantia polymorpha subsp. ruderalis]|uniref:DUF639 domain-containing protein n=2 Tax=Marchantia polymorpha TaxID=3197 RepID=A0AAF6BKE6_MARPO|nr:hypothetical protein MARPO_0058s0023 [Marchantia polymorpha]BBN12480.1 hypothetical protein Mp_5g20450 [Marchantia polymorpha subsp. ruderalis]|eukprot:PTQ37233.1 hypothetical protein MARPO_0058s0023 [Marchantia polymorpha]
MASLTRGRSFVESLMGDNGALKNLFKGRDDKKPHLERTASGRKKWIKELSSPANLVIDRCCRILDMQPEELQCQFEDEASVSAKHPSRYARNLLEYCCFKALSVETQKTGHLQQRDFHKLFFDMMLAWEAPGAANKPVVKVDVESTIGSEAFARIAPAIPLVADIISVHQQFDALTSGTGGRLPYPIFEKYLSELDKSVKDIKRQATASLASALKLSKGESVIEIDGTATTQPVLQHIGVSTWPGRLTLTDQSLYFEATGVVSYDKAKKFDLSADLKHVVKPDLTGPWGARLFDKAVMYKSSTTVEPVVLEFPELTGRTRRDYWLAIIREVVAVHQFIRTFRLDGVGREEALAKAILGIVRLRATREVFHSLPVRPEALLTFSFADVMPAGDIVLKALAEQLQNKCSVPPSSTFGESIFGKQEGKVYAGSATAAVGNLGAASPKSPGVSREEAIAVGEVLIGEATPLEKAVLHSRDNSKKVELAKATIDGVKVDGIGTNIAVMKELLVPLANFQTWIQGILEWEDPGKSVTFLVVMGYIIYRDWLGYIVPLVLLSMASYMLWLRHSGRGDDFNEVVVPTPPAQNTVEQLLALQQALSQLEGLLQSGNIMLLKLRALFFSVLPQGHSQMTNHVIAGLVITAFCLTILPLRMIILLLFLDFFTRNSVVRKETTERWLRRFREWWYSVPAVHVRFIKPEGERQN